MFIKPQLHACQARELLPDNVEEFENTTLSAEAEKTVRSFLNHITTEIHRYAYHRGERFILIGLPESDTPTYLNYTRKLQGETIRPSDALTAETYFLLKAIDEAGFEMQQTYVGPMQQPWSFHGPHRILVTW